MPLISFPVPVPRLPRPEPVPVGDADVSGWRMRTSPVPVPWCPLQWASGRAGPSRPVKLGSVPNLLHHLHCGGRFIPRTHSGAEAAN